MTPLFVYELTLVLLCTTVLLAKGQSWSFPEPTLELLVPQGIRISVPDDPSITLFAVHFNINKTLDGTAPGQFNYDVKSKTGSRWVFTSTIININRNDNVHYWLYIIRTDGLGYHLTNRQWSPQATESIITTVTVTRAATTSNTDINPTVLVFAVALPVVIVLVAAITCTACIFIHKARRKSGQQIYTHSTQSVHENDDGERTEGQQTGHQETNLAEGNIDYTTLLPRHSYLELEPTDNCKQTSVDNPLFQVTDSYLIPPLENDKLNSNKYENENENEGCDNIYINMLLDRLQDSALKSSVQQLLIPRTRLALYDQIGKGHFGKVHLGFLKLENMEVQKRVAIKTLHDNLNDTNKVEVFLQEGVIMHRFDHPNVLTLYGVSLDAKENPMVVLPYMANGDLRSFIKAPDKVLSVLQLLGFAGQIAEGMNYIAKQKFVHRDLAARNCMVDEMLIVKVADFGMTRNIYESEFYITKGNQALPVKWMAPESLDNGIFTMKSDVWSYGVLLWELMTRGRSPYPDIRVNVSFEMKEYLRSGRRMEKPKDCPENIYILMGMCWAFSPEDRPTFSQLVAKNSVISQSNEETQSHENDTLYRNICVTDSMESLDNRSMESDFGE